MVIDIIKSEYHHGNHDNHMVLQNHHSNTENITLVINYKFTIVTQNITLVTTVNIYSCCCYFIYSAHSPYNGKPSH